MKVGVLRDGADAVTQALSSRTQEGSKKKNEKRAELLNFTP